jgi:hypothetical protein
MERTTDLKVLVEQIVTHMPVLFTWGEFISFHEVGEYSIIEYHPWKSENSSIFTGQPSKEISFHPYINGRDLSTSFSSLDEALAFCIAYKFDGCLEVYDIFKYERKTKEEKRKTEMLARRFCRPTKNS